MEVVVPQRRLLAADGFRPVRDVGTAKTRHSHSRGWGWGMMRSQQTYLLLDYFCDLGMDTKAWYPVTGAEIVRWKTRKREDADGYLRGCHSVDVGVGSCESRSVCCC